MSIEKKSLISTLKTTKRANVAVSSTPEVSQKISKHHKVSKIHKVAKVSKVQKVAKVSKIQKVAKIAKTHRA